MLADFPLIGFIPSADADRARTFYVDILKLSFVSDDQFAVVLRTRSSMIRIVRTGEFTPVTGTILGWEVPDLAATVTELTASGVAFERYPFLKQNEQGIWDTPDGSRVAWFKDPDGNTLSVSQH